MTDREKVIKGLEMCLAADLTEDENPCAPCPFLFDGMCQNTIKKDALALLREQEPVAHAAWLGRETSTAYDLYGVKTWAVKYKCSKCGFVHRAIEAHMCYNYCPMCGARMDEKTKEGEVG